MLKHNDMQELVIWFVNLNLYIVEKFFEAIWLKELFILEIIKTVKI